MNRRERRVWKRKTRRIGVLLASVALAATTAGLGGAALADPDNRHGEGGNLGEPGTGSGANLNVGHETIYCNGHLALYLNNGTPAHTECDF
jgi:hypothetical protein